MFQAEHFKSKFSHTYVEELEWDLQKEISMVNKAKNILIVMILHDHAPTNVK